LSAVNVEQTPYGPKTPEEQVVHAVPAALQVVQA